MGREWEWEIPFRPEGLAGSAVCVREIIFSVYSSVVSLLSYTLAAPLSDSLFFLLNKFFPLAVVIFECLIIYFHRSSCPYCPYCVSVKPVSSGLTEVILRQTFLYTGKILLFFAFTFFLNYSVAFDYFLSTKKMIKNYSYQMHHVACVLTCRFLCPVFYS